jgi:hypothetical protein
MAAEELDFILLVVEKVFYLRDWQPGCMFGTDPQHQQH